MRSRFLIGAAIGSGSTALAAERGGADILLAINAGRLRNMGAPSIACMLPVFDSPTVTETFARDELLAQCSVPVLLGIDVWGADHDPQARARAVRDDGFAGAVNFPSCMHFSKPMQQLLSRAGRGIEQEVEQLRAIQDIGLTAMFYCATRTQARLAADAGIDHICLNLGWNVGGALGHRRRATIEEAAVAAREIGRLVKRIHPATKFFLEGGPIGTADDLAEIIDLAPIDGYVGGSTIERLPLEVSVSDQVDRFRQVSRRRAALDSESERLLKWAGKFGFAGRAKSQLAFLRRLRALAGSSDPVLLVVEPGLSPAPVLRALNDLRGPDNGQNVVHIDVAGEDFPTRARNLLFGHPDGGTKRPPVLADGATGLVVIHEPQRLPAASQRRLARALREGLIQLSDSRRTLAVTSRIVLVCEAATRGAGGAMGLLDGFVPELALALHGRMLRPPPIRERSDDIPVLIERMSREATGIDLLRSHFSTAALQTLRAHPWPRNEAELRALLGGLAGRAWDDPVQPAELTPFLQGGPSSTVVSDTEKDRIVEALWRHGFSRTRSAQALGMSRKTLYNKMRKFGLSA